MKKGLLIFLAVIVFIVAALAILPIFFKDEIQAKIKDEIAKNVDAKVNFEDLDLSLFSNFPKLTISIDKLSMLGTKEGFKGDTLFSADNFNVAVDVMSVISGDKIKVNGIYLDKPYILTKFTKDGKMSWDVTKPSTDTATAAPSEPSNFTIAIDEWKIEDGTIIYDDQSMPMYTELRHVTHKGSGEMAGDVFTMDTKTTTPEFYVSYDNVTYLNKHKLDAEAKLSMDLAKSEYRFMENKFKINDFLMHFEGLIAMPTDDIVMDLKFRADETEFKNLISLIPAIYTKDYENIKTDGKIGFDGWYKGTMTATQMPGFGVNLVVKDAMMQYPNLTPVTNIGVDVNVVCQDGNVDNTIIDLKKFDMDMGKNPVRATALVKGLGPADIDANVKATLNLADVNKIYPIEGTTLAGIFNLDLTAKGTYDDAKKQMPMVNAKMKMTDGYVKSADVPFPLEKLNFNAVANSNGDMATSNFLLEGFRMMLDGEPIEMRAYVENFENINFDVNLKGLVDLAKLTKVYPMEGMTLAGRINADISSKGAMADVDAGRYDKINTSGTMGVKDFSYVSTDMPQGMKLSSANFSLTPEKMSILNMDGYVGKSDISIKGYFSNYMGYMFGGKDSRDTVIHGNMSLASKKFDTDEWMSDEETPAADSAAAEEPMTVFEVPKDIDFLFASTLKTVLYDGMTMTDMIGNISMKDGILRMDHLGFNTLGGAIVMNGGYNTQNIKDPKFDFDMKVTDVNLAQAASTFEMIKKYAPIAGNMDGKFSMNLDKISGSLGQDMMPVYKTVNGAGLASIASAVIKDNKVLSGVGSLTKMQNVNPMKIQDVKIKFKLVDGSMVVEPFDVKAGDMKMNVSGKQSLEGALDYLLKMDVPAGALGTAANNALASLTGSTPSGSQNIKMDFKVTGTHDKPKVGLAGSSTGSAKDAAKDAVADKVNAEVDKAKAEAEAKARAEADKAKAEAEAKIKAEQERIKKEAEAKAKSEAEKKAKDALKGVKIPKF
jgi:hypothetical protein